MIRLILLQLGLFLLPFLCFWLWVKLGRRLDAPRPTFWLVIAGLVCAIAGFIVVGAVGNGEPGGDFVPTRQEDGRLLRGGNR